MTDALNLAALTTVEPGANGTLVCALMVTIEIVDGKIVSSSLCNGYHFRPEIVPMCLPLQPLSDP